MIRNERGRRPHKSGSAEDPPRTQILVELKILPPPDEPPTRSEPVVTKAHRSLSKALMFEETVERKLSVILDLVGQLEKLILKKPQHDPDLLMMVDTLIVDLVGAAEMIASNLDIS